MADFEIFALNISSYDEFHREQRIKDRDLIGLEMQAELSEVFKYIKLAGASSQDIMPIGRAKEMEIKKNILIVRMPVKTF